MERKFNEIKAKLLVKLLKIQEKVNNPKLENYILKLRIARMRDICKMLTDLYLLAKKIPELREVLEEITEDFNSLFS